VVNGAAAGGSDDECRSQHGRDQQLSADTATDTTSQLYDCYYD